MFAIDYFGKSIVSSLIFSWDVFCLFYLSLRSALLSREQSFKAQLSVIAQQIYYTGFQALPAIVVLGAGVGALVVIQSESQFNLLGTNNMLGQLFISVIMREVAPLLTVLIVIARSGTAVATEIGNMKVNREVEALESVGIHPLVFIVAPRIMAGIVSVLCLCLYFLFAAFLAGLIVSVVFYDLPIYFYSHSIFMVLSLNDVLLFLAKVITSGIVIFSVCCYRGLKVNKATYEVPQATTGAVVQSVMIVVFINLALTAVSYAHKLNSLGVF